MNADQMRVKIRVHALEGPWGSGPTSPAVREVTIAAVCPTCGGRRGEPRSSRQHDDGETYYVHVWDNDCGHIDHYASVAVEAGLVPAPRTDWNKEPTDA